MVGKENLPGGETDCVKYVDEEVSGLFTGPVKSFGLTRESMSVPLMRNESRRVVVVET